MTTTHARTSYCTLGLSCYLLLVLFALLSGSLYENAVTAFAHQIPLTVSGDVGAAAGLAVALALSSARARMRLERFLGTGLVITVGCGLCVAVMLRAGMLFAAAPWDTVLGDGLFGLFLALGAWLWWRVLLSYSPSAALGVLARGLAGACIAFIGFSLLPQGVILLVASVGAPVATCLCVAQAAPASETGVLADTGEARPCPSDPPQPDPAFPTVLVSAVIGSVFVADLLMSLFPVSLYTEASPVFAVLTGNPEAPALGNLTEPALIAALILFAFGLLLDSMARRGRVRLPLICSLGFFAVAVGFVTFPYHMPGGAPIGIAEAGEVIVAVFALAVARSYIQDDPPDRWTRPTLFLALGAVAAMVVADAIIIALYQLPFFDYIDFRIRTVLGGVGVLALVGLLVGLMPHVYTVAEHHGKGRREQDEGSSEGATESTAEQILDRFAERHRLSPREREVVELLSQGRDVPYIEQELVLSKSTVKTHIRHIYEKCQVSSRQDLLDLLHSDE